MPFDPTQPFQAGNAKPKFDPTKPVDSGATFPAANDPSQGSAWDRAMKGLAGAAQPMPEDPQARGQYMGAQADAARLAGNIAASPFSAPVQAGVGAAMGASTGSPAAAAIGGALPMVAKGVSGAADSAADYLAQKSVGLRKFMSGTGTRLLDQGIWGTKNGMRDAVNTALPGAEGAVQDAVKGIPGKFDPEDLAKPVEGMSSRYITPDSGDTLNGGELQKIQDKATALRSMGDEQGKLSASDVLSLKRQADSDAYLASGNKGSSLEAALAGKVGGTSRDLLNTASGGATGDALANEGALIKAKSALNRPDTLRQGVPMTTIMGGMLGGTAGGEDPVAHLKNAALGALLANGARSPLLQSTAAKGLSLIPDAASVATPGVNSALMNLLSGGSNGSNSAR